LFSSAKILISDRRNRLGDDLIAAVECLKSWESAGLVEIEEFRQVEALLHALEKPVNKEQDHGIRNVLFLRYNDLYIYSR